MYLRQRWRDPRLASNNFSSDGVLINSKLSETWLPDLYFVNAKEAKKSDVTIPNFFLRVNDKGDLLYSLRLSMTVDCYMDLRLYPFDVQTCTLQLESCEFYKIFLPESFANFFLVALECETKEIS